MTGDEREPWPGRPEDRTIGALARAAFFLSRIGAAP